MKTNDPLKNQIFEIIENQMRDNNPKRQISLIKG